MARNKYDITNTMVKRFIKIYGERVVAGDTSPVTVDEIIGFMHDEDVYQPKIQTNAFMRAVDRFETEASEKDQRIAAIITRSIAADACYQLSQARAAIEQFKSAVSRIIDTDS